MQLTRMTAAALVAITWMSFGASTARADTVTWSAAVSGCVADTTGLAVYGSYVYNHGGGTVMLFCAIAPAELRGGFDTIEVSYNAGNSPTAGARGDMVLAELREVNRSTTQVTVKCGVAGAPGATSATTPPSISIGTTTTCRSS